MGLLGTARNILASAVVAGILGSQSVRAQSIEDLLKEFNQPIDQKIAAAQSFEDLATIKYPLSSDGLFSSTFLEKARAKAVPLDYIREFSPLFLNGFWLNAQFEDFEALFNSKTPKSYIEQLYSDRRVKMDHDAKAVADFYAATVPAEFVKELSDTGLRAADIVSLHGSNVPTSYARAFRSLKGNERRFGGAAITHFWSKNISAGSVAGFLKYEKTNYRIATPELIASSIEANVDARFAMALSDIWGIKFDDIRLMSEDKTPAKYVLSFKPNDFSFTRTIPYWSKHQLADTFYILNKSKVTPQYHQWMTKTFKDTYGNSIFSAWDMAYFFRNREKHKQDDIQRTISLFDGSLKGSDLGAAVKCLFRHNLIPDFRQYLKNQSKRFASASDLDAFTYEKNRTALEKAGYLREPDNQSSRQKAIVWLPRSDWNCAFYHAGMISQLEEMRRHFDVYVTFAATPEEFAQFQDKFTSYDLLIDAGHGSQGTISKTEQDLRLHADKGTKGAIRMNDPVLRQYYSKLSSSGTHILYACSNAEGDDNLANTLARANRGVRVIAATEVSYGMELSFSPLRAQHYDLRGRDITKVIQH